MSDFGQQGQPPGGGFGQPPQGGYGQPAGGGGFGGPPAGGVVKPHRGPLLLGLSIAGFCCIIPAVVSIFLSRSDLKAMDTGEMDPEGRGLTQAAFWIGVVLSGLTVLAICANVVLTVVAEM